MRDVLPIVAFMAACGGAPAHPPTAAPVHNAAETPAPAPASPVLSITSIEPTHGDVEGGTYVRIRGSRFLADGPRAAKVYFGTREGTVVRFASDTELIVEAPGGTLGEPVDVLVVFEPGGTLKLPRAFAFVEKAAEQPSIEDLNVGRKDGNLK